MKRPIKKQYQYCTQGINIVNEFIAGAELFRVREQNKMAAFMLHQAAEQALLTIFKKARNERYYEDDPSEKLHEDISYVLDKLNSPSYSFGCRRVCYL